VLAAGHILDGRYEIVSIIASGGMGAVYRARRTLLLDEVAIKVILTDHSVPSVRERFMRESRASARLRHPNIVSILDFDIDSSGNPFLVMELLSGPCLKDEIAARRRLEVGRASDRAAALQRAAAGALERHRAPRSQACQHRPA